MLSSHNCLDSQLYGDAVADTWISQPKSVLPCSGENAAGSGAGKEIWRQREACKMFIPDIPHDSERALTHSVDISPCVHPIPSKIQLLRLSFY